MMRPSSLPLAQITIASPALADDGLTSSAGVVCGDSARPVTDHWPFAPQLAIWQNR